MKLLKNHLKDLSLKAKELSVAARLRWAQNEAEARQKREAVVATIIEGEKAIARLNQK